MKRAGEEIRCPKCDCLCFIPLGGDEDECPDCGHRLTFEEMFEAVPVTDDDLFYDR